MAEDSLLVPAMCRWIKPLSRGVDVNRNNDKCKSVVDYLDRVLRCVQFPDMIYQL